MKQGRTKAIKTPAAMMALFESYRFEINANPIKVTDWVGGAGKKVSRPKQRPLTMDGFEVFAHKKGFTVEHYFRNSGAAYEDFCTICSIIKKIIRADQIEGGMAGIYNPSITQRLNNLVEKTESTHIEQPLF